MTENEKKTILDTYALSLRLAASDAKGQPVALMTPDQTAEVEACIKAAVGRMTPLVGFALLGRLDGLSGKEMAGISGYNRLTIYQALNSAIQKINFKS